MGKALVLKTKDKPAMHLALDQYQSVQVPPYARRLATVTTPQELALQPNRPCRKSIARARKIFHCPKRRKKKRRNK
jgi:hypothetical protein